VGHLVQPPCRSISVYISVYLFLYRVFLPVEVFRSAVPKSRYPALTRILCALGRTGLLRGGGWEACAGRCHPRGWAVSSPSGRTEMPAISSACLNTKDDDPVPDLSLLPLFSHRSWEGRHGVPWKQNPSERDGGLALEVPASPARPAAAAVCLQGFKYCFPCVRDSTEGENYD